MSFDVDYLSKHVPLSCCQLLDSLSTPGIILIHNITAIISY